MSALASAANATALLNRHAAGDSGATARLFPLVYDRLRRLAAHYMKGERRNHTLQPTALVHEAYLRLIDDDQVDWQGKTHFLAVAAGAMRRVLIDHARGRKARKRAATIISLREIPGAPVETVDILALDEALEHLDEVSQRQARVFEMRFFSGLRISEVASVLSVSERTVKRDWTVARTWLARELYHRSPGEPP